MGTKTTAAPGAVPSRAPERARAGTSPTGTPSTGLAGLVRARLRASRAALLGLAAVTLLVAGTVGGTFAFVEQSSTQAVRTAPDLLTGPGSVLRVTTRLAPDPAAQDGTVRQIFASATGGAPVDVSRSLTTEARSASAADGTPLEQVVLSARTAAAGSTVPGPGEALLPTSAAEPLSLEVGDTVVVAEVPLVVVGLWEPDPGRPERSSTRPPAPVSRPTALCSSTSRRCSASRTTPSSAGRSRRAPRCSPSTTSPPSPPGSRGSAAP